MGTQIHPTAGVHAGAVLDENCEVGPYCIVGEHVRLGARCRLHSHVVIDGHTALGADNQVYPFACLGLRSQDLKFRGGVTHVEIGDRNVFREYVTVHSATAEGGFTRVGSDNNFLAYVHLAHDVQVGSHVIMSNVATLAGHVTVDDHAIIGGLAAVHQFCRIGRYSMLGGCSKVVQDIPPFMMGDGNPVEMRFINKVGLERNGFSPEAIKALTAAYKLLFREGLTNANALARIEAELPALPEVNHLAEFVRTSERGISK